MMDRIIETYYERFNQADYDGMLELLTEDVVHEPSQGATRKGKPMFREFLQHMERCYSEQVHDPVVFYSADGKRAAAEFMLTGRYLVTDGDLPPANDQAYTLRVGAFFDIEGDRIRRVSNHYNLNLWLEQISS